MNGTIGFRRAKRRQSFDRLIDAVRMGADVTEACEYVGIGRATYYRWQGRAGAGDAEYVNLFADLERAARHAAKTDLDRELEALAPTG